MTLCSLQSCFILNSLYVSFGLWHFDAHIISLFELLCFAGSTILELLLHARIFLRFVGSFDCCFSPFKYLAIYFNLLHFRCFYIHFKIKLKGPKRYHCSIIYFIASFL
jgi:hypothetical protein